jgi:hypothetical protein
VIGEMAHIRAHAPNGPRYDINYPTALVDTYDNLMLLCPTDHTTIDTAIANFPVSDLLKMKADHETWVQKQLDAGTMSRIEVSAEEFRKARLDHWKTFSQGRTWIILSITPLAIQDGVIDYMDPKLHAAINATRLPPGAANWVSGNAIFNHTQTRTTSNGIINEDRRDLVTENKGYRMEVFRSGHVEFGICLEAGIQRRIQGRSPNQFNPECEKVIAYDLLARTLTCEARALRDLWRTELQFKEMVLTVTVTQTMNACLWAPTPWDAVLGEPVEDDALSYATVIDDSWDAEDILEHTLMRIVHYFGLALDEVYSQQGEFANPRYHH